MLLRNAKLTFCLVGYLAIDHRHTENQIYSSVRQSSAMSRPPLRERGRDLGMLDASIRVQAVTRALNVHESTLVDTFNNATLLRGLLKSGGEEAAPE